MCCFTLLKPTSNNKCIKWVQHKHCMCSAQITDKDNDSLKNLFPASLLIEQQWPFFAASWDDPSFVFWPCVNKNQIITGRKTLCPKFTFGATTELQRAPISAALTSVERAGSRIWFILSLVLIRLRSNQPSNNTNTRKSQVVHLHTF